MIGDAGNEATNRYSPGEHFPSSPSMMPSLAGSAVNGARRITTRRFETAEMAQGGRNSRLHHTGVYPEGACCAARIRPTAWTGGEGGGTRGRPRRIGDAIWSATSKPSEIGANPARRRSIMGGEAPSWESRFPSSLLAATDQSIGERPCFWLGRWLDVCSRRCGRQADSVGRRWYPQAGLGMAHLKMVRRHATMVLCVLG